MICTHWTVSHSSWMALHHTPPLTFIVRPINYRPEKKKKDVSPLPSYSRWYVVFLDQFVTYCCLILSSAMLGQYLDLTICIWKSLKFQKKCSVISNVMKLDLHLLLLRSRIEIHLPCLFWKRWLQCMPACFTCFNT